MQLLHRRKAFRAGWTPASPTTSGGVSPALWLDARAIAGLSDGDAVATWSDLSGNGYHAAQGTAGYRPTYETGVVNGKPVVRFDGVDNHLLLAGALGIFRNRAAVTIFAVVSPGGTQAAVQNVFAGFTNALGSGRAAVQLAANPTSGAVAGGRRLDANSYQSVANTVSLSAPALLAARFLWTSSDVHLAINGGADSSKTDFQTDGNTSDTDSARVVIGCSFTALDVIQQQLKGDIAELIVYLSGLSSDDLVQLKSYLNTKWGLY